MKKQDDAHWPPPPKVDHTYVMQNVKKNILVNKLFDAGLGILLACILNFSITGTFAFFIAPHLPGFGLNPNPLGTISPPFYYGAWFILSTFNVMVYLLLPKHLKNLILAYVVTAPLCLLLCFIFVSSIHQLIR